LVENAAEKQSPWLIMLCFYFGRWPAWIDFFVESCKWSVAASAVPAQKAGSPSLAQA
jgi:hypothetical protein